MKSASCKEKSKAINTFGIPAERWTPVMQSRFFPLSCSCYVTPEVLYNELLEGARHAMEQLGPAQTERAYEDVLCNYLYDRRRPLRRQASYFNVIDGHVVPIGIVDVEIDHTLIVEIKANLNTITAEHRAQLQRYMRCAKKRSGTDAPWVGVVLLFAKDGNIQYVKMDDNFIAQKD